MSLPPVPPVMVNGSQVVYTGTGAADAHRLMRIGLAALQARAGADAMGVPDRLRLVVAAAEAAAADMRTSTDVRESPTSASSESCSWVGVEDAMRLLGVGDRQARRRIEQAGGTKTRKGWRVELTALLADAELRSTE